MTPQMKQAGMPLAATSKKSMKANGMKVKPLTLKPGRRPMMKTGTSFRRLSPSAKRNQPAESSGWLANLPKEWEK